MIALDIESLFDAEIEWERAVNAFDSRVRNQALNEALKDGERAAVNTRHYQDRTALLTSRIKGYVGISVPGAAEAFFGAFTDYASFVNRWDANQGSMTFKAPNGMWVTMDLPEGFVVRGGDQVAVTLLEEVELAAAELQERVNEI